MAKKIGVYLLIAALVLAGALVFVGCDEGSSDDNNNTPVEETDEGKTPPEEPGSDDDNTPPEEPKGEAYLGETFAISSTVFWSSEGCDIVYGPLANLEAVSVRGPFASPLAAEVTEGSTFSVTIPVPDQESLGTKTKQNFADMFLHDDMNEYADKITTYSPTDAKFGVLDFKATAIGIAFFNELRLGSSSASSSVRYMYLYVDKDVIIKGLRTGNGSGTDDGGNYYSWDSSTTVDLSLKQGWNVVETSREKTGTDVNSKSTEIVSVNGVPENAKWLAWYDTY